MSNNSSGWSEPTDNTPWESSDQGYGWDTAPPTRQTLNQSSGGRGKRIVIIVATVVLLAGAIFGGAMISRAYINSDSFNPTGEQVPALDEITSVEATPVEENDDEKTISSTSVIETEEPTELTVEPQSTIEELCEPTKIIRDINMPEWDWVDHCDGEFAVAGKAQSDWLSVVKYDSGQWIGYDHCAPGKDNTVVPADLHRFMTPCENTAARQVAPARSAAPSTSIPSCDGRGILIVHSVVEQPGVNAEAEITQTIQTYPGAKSLRPGHCPSLRANLDGAAIYPVYIDYGFDTQALCAGKAQYGGNARMLNTEGNFSDPC